MPRALVIILIVFGLVPSDTVSSQTVAALVRVDSISVGERTDLVLRVVHDGDRRVIFPDQTGAEAPQDAIGTIGDFELIGRRTAGYRDLPDGSRLDSVVYDATTFVLDSAWVAPVVAFATETDTLTASGPPILVPVRSTVPPEAQDILDIAPLAEFPRTWWPWFVALVLIVAGWLLWRRFRRPDEEEPEPEPEPEPGEAPLDEALRRLAALAETDLSTEEALKPFFVELSDILRTYVARRTGVPALELTTGELIAELRGIRASVHLSRDRVGDLDRLLRAADLVKFADYHPPVESARSALDDTAATVRVTETDLRAPATVETGPAE